MPSTEGSKTSRAKYQMHIEVKAGNILISDKVLYNVLYNGPIVY